MVRAEEFERFAPAAMDPLHASIATGNAIACASGTRAAKRVVHSLNECCATLAKSCWPGVAWCFSGLTADGSPLEFTFSSADNLMRFTVDAAGAECNHEDRLAAACDLASRLGHERPAADDMDRWGRMQQYQELRWGARLGVRESGGREKVKYYLEVPPGAQASIRTRINPPLSDSIAVMIGCDPESSAAEYYFRQQKLSKTQLDRLLAEHCDHQQRTLLQDEIESLCGMPIASALEWIAFGYSLVQPRGTAASQISLFVRCMAVGGPGRARHHMLRRMADSVKTKSLYCRLIADLPVQEVPDHGVVSLSPREPDVCEMRIGLSSVALSRLVIRESMSGKEALQ